MAFCYMRGMEISKCIPSIQIKKGTVIADFDKRANVGVGSTHDMWQKM